MTWRARAAQFLLRVASRNLPPPAKPKTPPLLVAAFYIPPALQPNNVEAGVRSVRRVCMAMQQKQCALNGWNYARQFRS
jgi:hypothetical protein